MRCALVFERLQRRDAGVDRIAVVGTAAPVEQTVFVLGGPRAEVVTPACELGLLVEVTVHQHGVGHGGAGGRYFKKQHRRATFEADDFDSQALDLLRLGPGRRIAQHGVQMAVRCPVGIEAGGLGRYGNVLGQLLDDIVVPLGCDIGQDALGVEQAGGHFAVQGGVHLGISGGGNALFCA